MSTGCALRRALAFLAVLMGLAPIARASSDYFPPRYEVALGVGGVKAFENDIFNVTPDYASKPGPFVDLRVRENLNGPWAFGVHIQVTGEKTGLYSVVPVGFGSPVDERFDLTLFHVGVDTRYMLIQGPLQPYLEAGISYVGGSADASALGTLSLSGYSIEGGPGAMYLFNRNVALAVEGVFAAGAAQWDRRPFVNSTNRDYNPSLASVAGMFVYRWGD